ncbi:hypothetical protein CPB86DRAFT_803595 [Serendipita vermifera]|nr:hypothetical protein CPB86DRAFT_803595 [Serendipita vermifera]
MDASPSPDQNSAPDVLESHQNDYDTDEKVRTAATALQDMRAGSSHDPLVSSTHTPPVEPAFSRLPSMLNSAINVYEYGKANSRIVSYSANMVESGVQAISNRLPTRVLNYARAEPLSTSPTPPPPSSRDDDISQSNMQLDNSSERESSSSDLNRDEQRQKAVLSWTHQQREEAANATSATTTSVGSTHYHRNRRTDSGRNPTGPERRGEAASRFGSGVRAGSSLEDAPHSQMNVERNNNEDEPMDLSNPNDPTNTHDTSSGSASRNRHPSSSSSGARRSNHAMDAEPSTSQAVSRRGGWHTLMVEAGGISAAVSDESMRKLKYCLEWLQWATANLDTQITLLETFISSINATVTGEPVSPSATVSPEALQHYMSVKRNVVNTIRQVVEVVGKYAGGSLPEPAKQKVKGFILSLPGRWSVAVRDAGLGDGWEHAAAAAASPDRGQQDGDHGGASAGDASASTDAAATHISATTSARLGSSSTNPRKRNRLESSTQSVVSSDAVSSSNTTVVGSISAGSSSVNLAGSSSTSASTIVSAAGAPTTSAAGAVAPPGAKRPLLPPTAGAARHAAHRVLTLAQESLHAVKGVTAVFKDTLDRAETWVDRLRRVGYSPSQRTGNTAGSSRLLRHPRKEGSQPPSMPLSPTMSSPRSPMERRRLQMTPRELHLEALARSIPSVGPYGPYGTGNTPPMSPVLGPQTAGSHRQNAFPFDNPAPGAPGYGWVGSSKKSDGGLSAVPTLNLGDTGGRSRAGSMSQYESSTGESLPPPSVVGSTSSVGGDDELDEEGDHDKRSRINGHDSVADEDEEGVEFRHRKRRRREDDMG